DDGRGAGTVLREQGTPLVNQDGWDHESEGFTEREGDRERDVRLAQAHGVGEQRAVVASEDAREPLRGGDLMWREPSRPRGPRRGWLRWPVEQRPRPECGDRGRRGFLDRRWREEARERLRERREVLREDQIGRASCRERGGRWGASV